VKPLDRFLRRARRRIVGQEALIWLARGLALFAVLALAVEVLGRRYPVDPAWPLLVACAALAAVMSVGGWMRAWPSLPRVARRADAALGGRERLATALEFATAAGALVELQRADALRLAATSDAAAVAPARLPWRPLAVALVAGVAAIALALLPNPALVHLRQQRAAAAAQEQAAEKIEAISKQIATSNSNDPPGKKEALTKELQKAADSVRKAPDPATAVASLSQAQDAIRSLTDPNLAAKQAAESAAGKQLAGQATTAKAGSALAAQNSQQASTELKNLASSLPSMNAADRAATAQALASAAQAAQGDPQLQQSLQKASDALKNGDVQAAQQALQEAAQQVQQTGQEDDFQGDAAQAVNGLQETKGPLAQAAQSQSGQGQSQGQSQGQGQNPGEGNQPGQSGQGQGQGQGNQPGQGLQPGQGNGANGQPGGAGNNNGGTQGGQKPGGNPGEKVYVSGQTSSGSTNGQNGDPGSGTDTGLVPYSEYLAEYQAQALNQVDRQLIPQQERDLVSNYFEALSK
jgi:hypothetical protein